MTSPKHTLMMEDLTERPTALSNLLGAAPGLSTSLQAQHTACQSTIFTPESMISHTTDHIAHCSPTTRGTRSYYDRNGPTRSLRRMIRWRSSSLTCQSCWFTGHQ